MKTLNFFENAFKIKNPIVTMGVFDGVHLGHQLLLNKVVDYANEYGGEPTVITFSEHPAKVIRGKEPLTIMPLDKRLELFESLGIRYTLLIDFDKNIAQIPPQDFVEKFLVKNLQIKGITIGENFRFGHKGLGTPNLLKNLGNKYNFFVEVQQHREISNVVVSSTQIREAICSGQCEVVREMLGRPFFLIGTVIEGKKRGRELGFPTANLKLNHSLFPADGVYIGSIYYKKRLYAALISIGTNPTFEDKQVSVEVYIEDFNEVIYGKKLEVSVLRKIRDQIKFDNMDELISRMNKDKQILLEQFQDLISSIGE